MPQATDVVINDGASTPVAHTLVPIGRDPKTDVLWFVQSLPAVSSPLAGMRLGYKQVRGVKRADGLMYSVVSLSVLQPYTDAVIPAGGTVPVIKTVWEEVARTSFDLVENASEQQRKNLRVMMQNLLGHTLSVNAIDKLVPTF